MDDVVLVSDVAHLMSVMSCAPDQRGSKLSKLMLNEKMRPIIVHPKILPYVIRHITIWLIMACYSAERTSFWSAIHLDDQLTILHDIAEWYVRDSIVSREYERGKLVLAIADLCLAGKQDAYFRLCIALHEGTTGEMVRIIDAADPQWFVVKGAVDYDQFVHDQLRHTPDSYRLFKPSQFVRNAIGRYAARKFVLPLLRATHPRLGMSPSGDISPASLLAGFAHLTRYIADVIADNDRALEGVP